MFGGTACRDSTAKRQVSASRWLSSATICSRSAPPAGLSRQSLGKVANGTSTRDCISLQEAADPTRALVALAKGNEGACTSSAMRFAGGTNSGTLVCSQGVVRSIRQLE
jgi:hypothetical protein